MDKERPEKRLSERLGLTKLKSKGQSFIPRAISSKKDSRVSNLAKHFEQLSREFERERVRERKLRAARNRQSRIYPLAAPKPIVEVYKDVDEAVDEPHDVGIFSLDRPDGDIGESAPMVEGHQDTDLSQTNGKGFHAEDTHTEATETEGEMQLSSHAPSDAEDQSDNEDVTEQIFLPDSPEDLLRLSQEDLEFKELPKHERKSLMQMLTTFWAERSSSGWAPLEYPLGAAEHVFADCDVIVREDEPSSIVAFALNSDDYQEKLHDLQIREAPPDGEEIFGHRHADEGSQADVMHSLLRRDGTHLKYQFAEGPAKMLCKIFFAEQFDAVRRKCGIAERIVESLSRCMKWDSKGGKTKSVFLKTLDDRFVLKSLSPIETQSFLKFAPNYFQIMSEAFFHELPSVIAKMLGFYQIIIKNPVTGVEYNWYLLLMENLFYDRSPTRIFDLKGSMRNRKIEATGERNEVLLDENMVEFIYESPLFAREHSKKLLRSSVHNDTLFLARQNVMDYSLMIAIDENRKELVVGIIDCIRTYTWDKKLESWIKDRGFAGGGKNRPTVTSPKEYKRRFREAMGRYVLEAPNCWHQFRPVRLERKGIRFEDGSVKEEARDGEDGEKEGGDGEKTLSVT
jgi:1-phosphatidylinositol-3-phosphate 5-kinase